MNLRVFGVCLAVIATMGLVSPLRAQVVDVPDVVTRSGKVLKGAVFIMADRDAVMVKHDGSIIEKLPLSDMPDHVQKMYHYVPARPAPAQTPKAAPSPAPPPAAKDSPLQSGDLIPLDTISADYMADRPAAEAKYRGKRFKITGTIVRIERDMKPRLFDVFLSSTDGRTGFKLITDIGAEYFASRDKVGYAQTDFKVDLVDGKMIGVQKTATTKGYDYYYYYGSRRTIDKNKSPWAPVLTVGDQITVTATCAGKSISVDFTNCVFEGLKLPFLTP